MRTVKTNSVTVDLETTGLDALRDKILLISYRFNASGPCITIDWTQPQEYYATETDSLRAALADPSVTIRGHNVKFDCLFLAHNGFEVKGTLDDTRILAYLNAPSDLHGLKHLVLTRLNRDVVTMDDVAVRPPKKIAPYFERSSKYFQIGKSFYHKSKFAKYNQADVRNCDDLKAYFPSSPWYRDVEQPVLRSLFMAELRGARLDRLYLQELSNEYTNELISLAGNFGQLGSINLNSSRQLAEFFRKKGLKVGMTPKGNPKMDKDTLKAFAFGGDADAKTLLRYRTINKLQNTYVIPFLEKMDRNDRIHGSFNQAGRESFDESDSEGTATGRLTSSDPNLQNIPARTTEGKRVRKAFIPSPGFALFDADLKQIEPRILAHFTQSPTLLKAYNEGLDTHAYFGSLIFNKPMDKLEKTERFIGKTCWLATVYGASAEKLKLMCERISEEPLTYDLGYYERVQQAFWQANPEIRGWREGHLFRTRRDGFIRTFGGRTIRVEGLTSKAIWKRQEAERMAVNYLIQGSAADCMKLVIVAFQKQIVDKGYGHLVATVHDELLGEIKLEYADKPMLGLLRSIMCDTFRLNNVPVETDLAFIRNWAEKN